MSELYDILTETPPTKVVLLALDQGLWDCERSLAELSALCEANHMEAVAQITQKRQTPETGIVLGSGKLEEASLAAQTLGAECAVFDGELTGSQIRNISNALGGLEVIDRTMLILEIFRSRAVTNEGKLQTELALLRYRLPRLAGSSENLSRLGGGIGTRGPGETKLETDKRHIRTRISNLSAERKEIVKRRSYARSRRKKDGVLVCAIVGYTNVGKSTLLNLLTDAGVLAENKLFATLETTSRAIELPDGRSLMLVDTVGLIRRLPHHLVEAFKSTLEEAANADVILHICDASAENCEEQAQVTLDLLSELGCDGIPVVTVFNKCDLLPEELAFAPETRNAVLISAKENRGMDQLLAALAKALPDPARRMRLLLPFSQGGLLNEIRSSGKLFSEEYTPDGVLVDAMVDVRLQKAAAPYETEKA